MTIIYTSLINKIKYTFLSLVLSFFNTIPKIPCYKINLKDLKPVNNEKKDTIKTKRIHYTKNDKNFMHSTNLTRVPACHVCKHPDLIKIEKKIIAHVSSRKIAEKFNVKDTSVRRHASKHMPYKIVDDFNNTKEEMIPKLIKDKKIPDPPEPKYVDTKYVVGRLQQLEAEALNILDIASQNQNFKLVLRAIKEIRDCLSAYTDLAAKLRYQASLQVLQSEQWRIIQSTMMTALNKYPDAKLAVSIALENIIKQNQK